jgi:adenosylhomocysteine nucleosidase
MKLRPLASLLALLCAAVSSADALAATTLDTTPRTAVISAFEPEWTALKAMLTARKEYEVHGTTFLTGTIERHPVVLFKSGISMVNAAMTAQLAIDRFTVKAIAFSGIAGGVDPNLEIGEAVFAREKNGVYTVPPFEEKQLANFGMIFPQPVQIARGTSPPEKRYWFPVDPQLLELARRTAGTVTLKDCTAEHKCLVHKPKIVVGGHGVSGQAFVDNTAFREWAYKTFDAKVLDMESAAVAQVAYANQTPFIAFRSLSDLAGGGAGENEERTFFQLASDNSAAFVAAFLAALP